MDDDKQQRIQSPRLAKCSSPAETGHVMIQSYPVGAPDTNGYVLTGKPSSPKMVDFKDLDPSHPEKCKIECIYIYINLN